MMGASFKLLPSVEEEVDTAVIPPLLQYPTGGLLSSVIIGKGTLRMFLLQGLLLLITEILFLILCQARNYKYQLKFQIHSTPQNTCPTVRGSGLFYSHLSLFLFSDFIF